MESDIVEEDVDDIFFPPAKPVRAASRPARAGRRAMLASSDEQDDSGAGDQPTTYGSSIAQRNDTRVQSEETAADKGTGSSGYSASLGSYNPSNRRRRNFLLGGLINKDPDNDDDGKENVVDNSESNVSSERQEKLRPSFSSSPQPGQDNNYSQDRTNPTSYQQQDSAPSRSPGPGAQAPSFMGRDASNAVVQPAQYSGSVDPPQSSKPNFPLMQNANAAESKQGSMSNGMMMGVGLNSMAAPSSMPAKGGFKFKFGGKGVELPSAGGMMAIHEERGQNTQGEDQSLQGNRHMSSSPSAVGPSVRSSHQSHHSFAPSRSEESSISPETSKPKHRRDGDVKSFKSDRLRLLEEELNALEVTQKLSNAYVDDKGQDLKTKQRKMNEPRSAEIDVQAKVDTGLRHGNDSESIKAELLKAYKQAEEYRRQCERYKTQLDQFTNAYDEIARLKNLVAEKACPLLSRLTSVQERSSLNKVHRQYQKEYKGQETLEAEHAERMRRLNEELRVSKARVAKYKEIHAELESQLTKAEDKSRDLDQKNRQLREKLRAVTGLAMLEQEVKAQLEEKDALIKKLEHDNLVLKRVAESSEKKLKAKSKEQAVGNQDLREHCKFLEEEIENKNRELRESQVIIKKQQSQLKRMRLDFNSLQKLNQPIEDNESGNTFLTGIDRYGRNLQSHPPDSANMQMDAEFYRHSSAGSKSTSEADSDARSDRSRQQSRKKVMAKKGRPGEKKRRSKVVNENNEMVRLDDGWKEERGGNKAQRKPITPADMAGKLDWSKFLNGCLTRSQDFTARTRRSQLSRSTMTSQTGLLGLLAVMLLFHPHLQQEVDDLRVLTEPGCQEGVG
ncbi:hypothetical protein GUITHDRAFT_139134 [Guillardia theta CCMP2712]|uniref:Lebercilin domain-containing protein n=1 Tax=Guillardia theta (strain CCMP2712) TaxID=905079 RepID=L1J9K4_GUITC|nr:hypothetical protein GUITHDRAFT_139134 [Guillardia theta CCMP2712]EKX45211.1 hypothetical protein GUITHDRAFT_139134 [Guillardia theta CCMP2712]|eukprot:XP_005832191.1 hypothetical protein GUITHDRAFT_139134 [Guillardia theta CCMP2712]